MSARIQTCTIAMKNNLTLLRILCCDFINSFVIKYHTSDIKHENNSNTGNIPFFEPAAISQNSMNSRKIYIPPKTPTFLPKLDDGFTEINLDFELNILGERYSKFYIGSNGVISFKTGVSDAPDFTKMLSKLPMEDGPPAIYPFWTDLDFENSGNLSVTFGVNQEMKHDIGFKFPEIDSKSDYWNCASILYEDVMPFRDTGSVDESLLLTFQVVICGLKNETFVGTVYDKIPDVGQHVVIGMDQGNNEHFFEPLGLSINSAKLSDISNVGKPGRFWYKANEPLSVDNCKMIENRGNCENNEICFPEPGGFQCFDYTKQNVEVEPKTNNQVNDRFVNLKKSLLSLVQSDEGKHIRFDTFLILYKQASDIQASIEL